jgi:hypothetical protein
MSEPDINREKILNRMQNVEPSKFEELVADLWEYMGYETTVTKNSSDRGLDVIATREFPYEEKNLIQAKRYSSTLSGPELREYVALTQRADVDLVIVVSTSGFTNQAKQEAEEYNIKLVNGKTLTQMLIDNNVVDLVRDYTDEIESTEIQTKKLPNPLDSSYTRDIQATVGEGESLSIEIVGYDNKIINFIGNEGNTIYYNEDHPDETSIECTIICLHVENKSSANWKFASEPAAATRLRNWTTGATRDTLLFLGVR